jgi:hypothetical protein
MNNRLKELAEQSGLIQYDTDSKLKDVEKFAELIVRECLSLARSHRSQIDDYAAGIDHVRDEIKEHFGVEE